MRTNRTKKMEIPNKGYIENNTLHVMPEEVLSTFMEERLQIIREREESEKYLALQPELKKRINRSKRMKVYALNKIFQSMANLIYFFEVMTANPKLLIEFEDDIKDLCDLRNSSNPDTIDVYRKNSHPSIHLNSNNLIRLLSAILLVNHFSSEKKDTFDDFRLKLVNQIYSVVAAKLINVYETEYVDEAVTKVLWEKLGGVLELASSASNKYKLTDQDKNPKRKVGFYPLIENSVMCRKLETKKSNNKHHVNKK